MVLTSTSYESFADSVVWEYLIQIFILVIALLLGNTVRRKVPFIRKSLMPTSLIGGLFILILNLIDIVSNNKENRVKISSSLSASAIRSISVIPFSSNTSLTLDNCPFPPSIIIKSGLGNFSGSLVSLSSLRRIIS